MAKKNIQTNSQGQASFTNGMVTDSNGMMLPKSSWTYARNAINNSTKGDLGKLSNEPSNIDCSAAPYTIIGAIHLTEARWVIFSTNNIDSEIGEFDEATCSYKTIVNDKCLNFKTSHLIKGVARSTFDCSYNVYWADGLNVDRVLDINNVPWVQICTDSNGTAPGGCITCVDTTDLDCEKLRLESILVYPTIQVKKGASAGSLLNGSYHIHIAYAVNGEIVSNYSTMSNIVSLFSHSNVNNSIEIELDNLDENFDEYVAVLVSTISEKTVARKLGTYSTNQNRITLDYVDLTLPVVPLENLPLLTPIADRSDAIFQNSNYLLRVAPTDKFEFNYQPLANQIQTYWTCIEYPSDYYAKGGTNVGHMRDEVYPYFIRFIHNTGDKTKAYHIPGRAARNYNVPNDTGGSAGTFLETASAPASVNVFDSYTPKIFEVHNTAYLTSYPNTILDDGGVLVAEGLMGYWESTEFYPDKNPDVWNSSSHTWSDVGVSDYDLCGKPIRHHKFPENVLISGGTMNPITNHYTNGGDKIRILGVRFDNIQPPVDNNGKPISTIVGYEILRGSRNGNKSVLYKGLINNMFEYDLPTVTNGSNRKGLYANYPFNDLNPDPFISKTKTFTTQLGAISGISPNDQYSKKNFTFHSPDVMFGKPFLVDDELKIYGEAYGNTESWYKYVDNHPKHKFLTNLTFAVGVIVGIGYAIGKAIGTRTVHNKTSNVQGDKQAIGVGSSDVPGLAAIGLGGTVAEAAKTGLEIYQTVNDAIGGAAFGFNSGAYVAQAAIQLATNTVAIIPGSQLTAGEMTVTYENVDRTPTFIKSLAAGHMFNNYMGDGANTFFDLVKNLSAYRQYALQKNSLCKYDNFGIPKPNNRRRDINIAKYLNPGLFELNDGGNGHLVNHLLRAETSLLNIKLDVENTVITDTSRGKLISQLPVNYEFSKNVFTASSHYVGVKNRLRNQYGKLSNVKLLPTQSNYIDISNKATPVIFGGDTYIGKYSEKNTLYYFQQWLNGQPNGYEHNYDDYPMFENIAYWMDTTDYDFNEFTSSVPGAIKAGIKNLIKGSGVSTFFNNLKTPVDKHVFDKLPGNNGMFAIKNAVIYLFNSGVREFFVESELNIDYRDYEDTQAKQHYPILTDLNAMFHNDIIKADNYYKLDRSLCTSFLPYSKLSWSSLQALDYDPLLADSCYTKREKRVLYSLPQEKELIKDNWRVFLPYNYKDFSSVVSAIKPIDKTAALILFETASPALLPGVDTLQTGSGTKLQIGDGALFSRNIQDLSNSEKSYEYGSCQSRLSVINTPAGVFWMSLNQGKLFTYAGGIKELSLQNDTFWINEFLPYKLTEDFPNFDLLDNPVQGIGCQTIYDNEYGLVYFCKKDYRLKEDFKGPNPLLTVNYVGEGKFLVGGIFYANTGDPRYFEDASWTLSYDPSTQQFISFHDWHPDLSLSGKNTFLTTKVNHLWRHNATCQSFCNFYGKDYPFEVEFEIDNQLNVGTIRNVEYYLENYIYNDNCYDRFLMLDRNFDEAVIYNTEQTSGKLKLVSNPKNDVSLLTSYPKINSSNIEILYAKEEQKYRFNQFWDIVKDRGEYTNVMEAIWKTESNGYIRTLNPLAVDYKKSEFQRKKFRHHTNRVLLKREKNDNVEMIITYAIANILNSSR